VNAGIPKPGVRVRASQKDLDAMRLPPAVIALTTGAYPHPLFEGYCLPPNDDCFPKGRCDEGTPDDLYGLAIPLWEHGNSVYEVGVWGVFCFRSEAGELEYWSYDRWFKGPTEPEELIAVHEQGLFFWVFWTIVDYHNESGEAWKAPLVAAAESIGFRHLDKVIAFHKESFSLPDKERKERLKAQCLSLCE
jgi:hypothetical protein